MNDTEYAPGYDEDAFRAIEPGDPVGNVIQSLGEPFRKSGVNVPQRWHYEELNLSFIVDKEGRVFDYDDPDGVLDDIKNNAPSSTELREILGPASSYSPATNRECWSYSRSASGNSNYWQRDIIIDIKNRVFGGSGMELVKSLLDDSDLRSEEIQELRDLLNDYEKE